MSESFPGLPDPPPPPEPRVAAAVIFWREGPGGREIFWVKRGGALRFAGGFYAFPGGRLDEGDASVPVPGFSGDAAALRACAAREIFEETGVLLARADRPPSPAERAAARRALLAGELDFGAFLARHGLEVEGERLTEAGRWITPAHFPVRYDAHLFLARLPEGETTAVWPGELTSGEWVAADDAVARWA